MIWNIRHQGSPESITGLSDQQIMEGLLDNQWEPTDEVKAPGETVWQSLEKHPHFAEAVSELDPPITAPTVDATHLDMNPLIDVSLVLLIFFVLTTTYNELRKMFPAPPAESNDIKQTIGENQLRSFTIRVVTKMQDGAPVILVENETVDEADLQAKFEEWQKKTGQSALAVEMDKAVPWKTFMAIQDAAAGAKIKETIRIERKQSP